MPSPLQYTLTRCKRASISLSVDYAGLITVRAPRLVPLYLINRFVESKQLWLSKTRNKILARTIARPLPDLTAEDITILKKELRHDILICLNQHARDMNLEPNKLKLTSARTRWGSCSSNKNINLNWRLALVPEPLRQYVIIHELAHLQHMNHSAQFWKLVEQFDPHYKIHQQQLQEFNHFLKKL